MAQTYKTEQQLQGELIAFQARLFQLDRERTAVAKQMELTEACLSGITVEREAVRLAAQETQAPPKLVAVPDASA